jgi:hypothetical protein
LSDLHDAAGSSSLLIRNRDQRLWLTAGKRKTGFSFHRKFIENNSQVSLGVKIRPNEDIFILPALASRGLAPRLIQDLVVNHLQKQSLDAAVLSFGIWP